MKNIAAVYKKKHLKTNWGFIFDTDVQDYVERFMQKIHVSDDDYVLWLEHEKPEGIYTKIKVLPVYDGENVIDAMFVVL
jgi:hypothetical protein